MGQPVDIPSEKLVALQEKHRRIRTVLGKEGLEMLDRMICFHPYERASAKELLAMEFFNNKDEPYFHANVGKEGSRQRVYQR